MDEFSEQWHQREPSLQGVGTAPNSRRLFGLAIAVSIALHGAALVLFFSFSLTPSSPEPPLRVRVNLLAINPQIAAPTPIESVMIEEPSPEPEPSEDPEESAELVESEIAITDSAQLPEGLVQNQNEPPSANTAPDSLPDSLPNSSPNLVSIQTEDSLVELPALEPTRLPASDEPQDPAVQSSPSLIAIQQVLRAQRSAAEASAWLFDCNPLQEDAGVQTCGENKSQDYSAVQRNPVYTALNPVRVINSSQRSQRTITANTAALAGRLEAGSLNPALSAYLLQEVEAGISLYTDNSVNAVQHMRRITDRSAAAQQAERVLGDPWIRTQARELQQRDVHAN